jgi:hypothetical protein
MIQKQLKMKIEKKKTILGLLLLAIALMVSCEDELDQDPQDDDAFTVEDFYEQDSAYIKALGGVYANLNVPSPSGAFASNIEGLDAGTSTYGRSLMNLQTFTTDEAVWSYENDPGIGEVQRSSWTAENVILRGAYGRIMAGVAFANEFLRQSTEDKLNTRGVSDSKKQEVAVMRAEARVLRALSYYHMMDLFGKAPLVTEGDPVGSTQSPEMTRQEVFNFVEEELLASIPELEEPMMNDYGRVDKGVAWMIIAKVYLNAEVYTGTPRYDDALEYTENVINAGYSLTDNYIDNFRADNDVNGAQNEIIFPIPADENFAQAFGPTTVMTNGAVGSIEQNGDEIGVQPAGWGGAIRLTPQFVSLFDGQEFSEDDRNRIIGANNPERTLEINDIVDQDQGYILEKFTDVRSDGSVGNQLTFSSVDFPMFRLADAYLMYAEAHLRSGSGSQTQAVGYINALRERANGGSSENISSSELTLDFIIDERARELYWESHRRQDLIRFGLFTGSQYIWTLKGNSITGVPTPDFRKLFPIPNASLAANQNLTQNPGY